MICRIENNWRGFLLILLVGILAAGCSTLQPSQPDPFAGIEAMYVKFATNAPAGAKFIAKVPYSVRQRENWEKDYERHLRQKAVELNGNLVVPDLDFEITVVGGRSSMRFGNHPIMPMNSGHVEQFVNGHNVSGQSEPGTTILTPTSVEIWSNIYSTE